MFWAYFELELFVYIMKLMCSLNLVEDIFPFALSITGDESAFHLIYAT